MLGIPIPIVAVSVGLVRDQYGRDELLVAYYTIAFYMYVIVIHSCWIDTVEGAIWAFVGPMLAIITVRFV